MSILRRLSNHFRSQKAFKKRFKIIKNPLFECKTLPKAFKAASRGLQEAPKYLWEAPKALKRAQNDLLKPPNAPFPVNKNWLKALNTLQMITEDFVKVTFQWWWPLYASQAVFNDNRRGQSKKAASSSQCVAHPSDTLVKQNQRDDPYFNRAIQLHTGHSWS